MSNMKTKIIPFDLEMAMKIQAGEIEGKMYVSDDTHNKIRLICTNRKSALGKIVALEEDKTGAEWIVECNLKGEFLATTILSSEQYVTTRCIVLEVPDNEPQFKPFDKVLVRKPDLIDPHDIYEPDEWVPTLFQGVSDDGCYFIAEHKEWKECIPYEGNEHLVGTTDKPKEN